MTESFNNITSLSFPGMRPAIEIETQGQPLGEIQKQQQEHIEKLYIYILQLEKRIQQLESRQ
jgi:hypothetical protein